MMFSLIFTVLLALIEELPPLEIPHLLDTFGDVVNTFSDVLLAGVNFFIVFLGADAVRFIGIYLGIIILLDSFYFAYQMIWWFITKIPMLGIKQ